MNHRRHVAHDLRHHGFDQSGVGVQLAVFVGKFVQRQQSAAHGIPRRIVAADDQQRQSPHELPDRHVPRRLPVRQHGKQIEFRWLRLTLLEQRPHIGGHFLKDFEPFLLGMHGGCGIAHVTDGDVGPPGQLVAFLEREIEQGRQHHGCQRDGNPFHPVELFAARQPVQQAPRAATDQRFHILQIVRCDDGAGDLALFVVLGRVHADEAGPVHVFGLILNLDAAQFVGKNLVVHFHLHDVLISRHRPIRAIQAVATIMHGVFPPQPFEIRVPRVVLVEFWVAHVEGIERPAPGVAGGIVGNGCVHGLIFSLRAYFIAENRHTVNACPRREVRVALPNRAELRV